MTCDDFHDHLNALLDGELPPHETAVLTAHLATCPACARRLEEFAALRAAIAGLEPETVSPALEQRIRAMMEDPSERRVVAFRKRRRPVAVLAAMAGIAALLLLMLRPSHDHLADFVAVRDAGLRGGLVQTAEIAAPAVPGFAVSGERADILAGHHAEVVTYHRNGMSITLCIWSAGREPAHGVEHATYRGTAIRYWNDGRQEYWVASTGPAAVVADFVTELRAATGA